MLSPKPFGLFCRLIAVQVEQVRLLRFETTMPPLNGGIADLVCRDDRIRTCDSCVPNAVRYRAALHPDSGIPSGRSKTDPKEKLGPLAES
jgi:hypothetical protein